MKRLIAMYRIAVGKNKDMIVFPIVGAFIWFFQEIALPKVDISWIWSANSWITSFIVTLTTYMLFDLALGNAKFFKEHKYIFAIISFLVSTFLSETISYQIEGNIPWHAWFMAAGAYVVGFVILLVSCVIGLSFGANRSERKMKEAEEKYTEELSSMSFEQRKKLISICNKALNVKGETFNLIASVGSKQAISELKQDLRNSVVQNKAD